MAFVRRYTETIAVSIIGFVVFAALNIMMLQYNYDPWTNPKMGFWTVFWNKFEVSGFDPFTYIIISKWRPLYALSRHPLLSLMVWPLSELNEWLKDVTGINCAIHIVAVLWTIISTASWLLMYRIMRKIMEQDLWTSLLLTAFFFSFSHVMLTVFVCDHMTITLFLLLLTIYLAGKAIRKGKAMPLWQSLPLMFISTGVTTTNIVKVAIADFLTLWKKKPLRRVAWHFALYLIPVAALFYLYTYQNDTTQAEETRSNERLMQRKAARDSVFAAKWETEKKNRKQYVADQLIHVSIATNTEYHIDRWPSLQENIFGEGLILHANHCLEDGNKQRPVLVRYEHWWYYVLEIAIVALFLCGAWCGRRNRIVCMAMLMFLFDMLLHVGLNFASADAYIMTAHWAYVIPLAVSCLFKRLDKRPRLRVMLTAVVLFLTFFMLTHNISLIYKHIMNAI